MCAVIFSFDGAVVIQPLFPPADIFLKMWANDLVIFAISDMHWRATTTTTTTTTTATTTTTTTTTTAATTKWKGADRRWVFDQVEAITDEERK